MRVGQLTLAPVSIPAIVLAGSDASFTLGC